VQVVVWPTVTAAGAQTTDVTLIETETTRLVELGVGGATLFVSPPYEACMSALPAPEVLTIT